MFGVDGSGLLDFFSNIFDLCTQHLILLQKFFVLANVVSLVTNWSKIVCPLIFVYIIGYIKIPIIQLQPPPRRLGNLARLQNIYIQMVFSSMYVIFPLIQVNSGYGIFSFFLFKVLPCKTCL